MSRFDGVAIVTGGGSGIGAATVRRLVADGARVALCGRTTEKLDEVAADLPADQVLVRACDVTDHDAVTTLVEATIERFGGLDLLVNNAGVGVPGTVGDVGHDDWQRAFDVNVHGLVHCCAVALPHLRTSGGSIVNVSSVSGIGGDWGMAPYTAAKGAVSNLTRSMAMDLASDGVRVNAVAPSLTDTPMAQGILDDDEVMARFRERIPMGRPADPSEVASVIAFLASPDAAFVTGVVLPVDGGLSASNGQPAVA